MKSVNMSKALPKVDKLGRGFVHDRRARGEAVAYVRFRPWLFKKQNFGILKVVAHVVPYRNIACFEVGCTCSLSRSSHGFKSNRELAVENLSSPLSSFATQAFLDLPQVARYRSAAILFFKLARPTYSAVSCE